MADSVLPPFGEWWRSNGVRDGDGALIRAGSSSTLFDSYAMPRDDGKWTIEYEYSADDEAIVWIVINRYSDANVKLGDGAIFDRRLQAAQNSRIVLDMEFPAKVDAKWLPSVVVRSGGADVKFNYVKVYKTTPPPPAGPTAAVWDGDTERPCAVTVWDGTRELPATVEIQS